MVILKHLKIKIVALSNPIKGLPSNAVFHPTIETVGFQTAFSVRSEENRKESEDQAGYTEKGKEKEEKKEKGLELEKEKQKKEAKKVKQTKQKIKVNMAYLYEYPDRESKKLGKLGLGDIVEVLEIKAEEDDAEIWCYVKIKKIGKKEDVQYGWILFSAIESDGSGKSRFSVVTIK